MAQGGQAASEKTFQQLLVDFVPVNCDPFSSGVIIRLKESIFHIGLHEHSPQHVQSTNSQ